MSLRKYFFALVSIFFLSANAFAEVNNDDMNKSNNPLTPMLGVNFHDYWTTSIFGTDDESNTFYLRGALPHKLFELPQIARLSMPYQSVPGPNGDTVTGFGDMNLFDIFLLKSIDGIQYGIGPYFVFPTASKDETGAGKWQIGASGVVMAPEKWGLWGALITYQHDIAGNSDRPTQNIATLQPLVIRNMSYGSYVRTTGIWYFNWETGDYYIPLGFGVGKVWKLQSGTTVNIFGEPQWTVAHEGNGVPNFQTFFGMNLQFPL